jgi:hypothetical protein
MQQKKYKNNIKKRGIATLPTVMLLGMMTLAVVVSIASLTLNQLFISQGQSQSQNALFYAEGGARDALTRIARDKNYICDGTNSCNGVGYYSLDFSTNGCANNTECAKVTVSGTGVTGDLKTIVSTGVMKSSTRKMQVTVLLDGGTSNVSLQKGEITSASWTELTN